MLPRTRCLTHWWVALVATWLMLLTTDHAQAQANSGTFEAIVDEVGTLSHDESCQLMQAWIDAHPDAAQVPQGLLWMSRLRLLDGRQDLSRPLLERVLREWPATRWALWASKELADLDLANHHFRSSIKRYEDLARNPDPFWSEVGRTAAGQARAERFRYIVALGLASAMVVLGLVRLTLSALARRRNLLLPLEAIVALPVVVFLLVAAEQQPPPEARAVVAVALGGLAVLWTTALHVRSRAVGWRGRVLESGLGVVQACALLYCAIVIHGLWPKFVGTLLMGND